MKPGINERERIAPLIRLAKALLLSQLGKIRHGRLRLIDSALDVSFGALTEAAPFDVTLSVRNPRF
jgi:hypothetical protein